MSVLDVPSPNFDTRKGSPIDILMLHYTGMPKCDQAVAWLANPESKVSSHYVITEAGRVIRMVDEANRAWHAGVGSWAGAVDVNARSIGIEICNAGHPGGLPPFPDVQIAAVIELSREILARHPISPERVIAHSDSAPGRKVDPGELFPWDVLAKAGVGHWVLPSPISGGRFFMRGDRGEPVAALQSMFALYGYGLEITGVFDERTVIVVEAFQRHFRQQRVDGVADASTIETLHRLLKALPEPSDRAIA